MFRFLPSRLLRSLSLLLAALLLIPSGIAHAACSTYKGQATINEINAIGTNTSTSTNYIEVKILDANLLALTNNLAGWKLRVYRNSSGASGGTGCSASGCKYYDYPLDSLIAGAYTSSTNDYCQGTSGKNTYIRVPLASNVLQDDANLVLLDGTAVVDLLRTTNGNNSSNLPTWWTGESSCANLPTDTTSTSGFPYDTDIWNIDSNRKNIGRLPDGVGPWVQSPGNGANSSNSLCTTNDSILAVAKSASPTTQSIGGNVTYTITVTNGSGTASQTGVTVTDTLPSTVSYQSSTVSQGSLASVPTVGTTGAALTWNVGTLGAGISATLSVTVKVASGTAGATVTNTAKAQSTELGVGYTSASGSFTISTTSVSSFAAYQYGLSPSNALLYTRVAGGVGLCTCIDGTCPSSSTDNSCKIVVAGLKSDGTTDTADSSTVVNVYLQYCSVVVRDAAGVPTCNIWNTANPLYSSGNQTLSSGLATLSPPAIANVYEMVRVAMTSSTISSGATFYSTDYFAIRPNSFSTLDFMDSNWTTAGTSRSLLSSTASATTTHKAGRPLTIKAVAQNASNAATTNYPCPVATNSACVAQGPDLVASSSTTVPSGGVFGTLTMSGSGYFCDTVNSFSAGSCLKTAKYSEVGLFTATVADSYFAKIDATDGTSNATWQVQGTVTNVGRFIPDRFLLNSATTALANRSDAPTTTTSASITAGATSIPLTSASGFAIGQSIIILGAGPLDSASSSGMPHVAGITAVTGSTLTIDTATITTIASGKSVYRAATAYLLTAGASSGVSVVAVNSSSGLSVGDAIVVPGAGTSGATLETTVTNIAGSVLTLASPIVTTVASGTRITRSSDFTYHGEPFLAVVGVQAQSADATVTQNYTYSGTPAVSRLLPDATAWLYFSPGTADPLASTPVSNGVGFGLIDRKVPSVLTSRLAVDSTTLFAPLYYWSNGNGVLTANLSMSRPSTGTDGPFDETDAGIFLQDADGVTLVASTLDLNADNAANSGPYVNTPYERRRVGTLRFRQGRIILQNAFGSEKLPLSVVATSQYYDGSVWRTNTSDSTTKLVTSATSSGDCTGNGTSCACYGSTTCPALTSTCTSPSIYGVGSCANQPGPTGTLVISRPTGTSMTVTTAPPRLGAPTSSSCPGSGITSLALTSGTATICLSSGGVIGAFDLNLMVPSWLQTANGNPKANVAFGIYNANSKVIYRREVR